MKREDIKMVEIPRDSKILVTMSKLGSVYFSMLGGDNPSPMVRDFFTYHEAPSTIDIKRAVPGVGAIGLRSGAGKWRSGLENLFDQHHSYTKVWNDVICDLVRKAHRKLYDFQNPILAPYDSYLQEALDNAVKELEQFEIEIDAHGELKYQEDASRFISDCILKECESIEYKSGDLQVNETMARIQTLEEGSQIIEIGAGKGRCLSELATMNRFKTWKYLGVNFTDEEVSELNEVISGLGVPSNSQAILNSNFENKDTQADYVFCVNVLHGLLPQHLLSLFEMMSNKTRKGATMLLHDFSFTEKVGEQGISPVDKEFIVEILTGWCSEITHRTFESRGSAALWTVSAKRTEDFQKDTERLKSSYENLRERYLPKRNDASKAARPIWNEYCSNLSEKILAL